MSPLDHPLQPMVPPFERTSSSVTHVSEEYTTSPLGQASGTDSPESQSSFSALSSEQEQTKAAVQPPSPPALTLHVQLADFFAENVAAKIWKVAARELQSQNPPTHYPEFVPTTGPTASKYNMTEADFWTCGFFPGSLYALLERSMKYPQFLHIPAIHRATFGKHLLELCHAWAGPIRSMATRTDTHDMGFIIQPALRMDWELTGNLESLKAVITAAQSLASRFDQKVGAIRSWDDTANHRYSFANMETDFLVIIDSMCNLDLLYYAGHQTGNQKLIDIATTHAHTVLRAIVRDDWSTYHLVNFDPKTGAIKEKLTNQGYRDWSTWSRGQAWAILGFIQTYIWTQDPEFLQAAISLAAYFLSRLSSSGQPHPFVPLWDFDAPETTTSPRDASAGMIAANGLLILSQMLTAHRRHTESARFMDAVVRIAEDTVALALAKEKCVFRAAEALSVLEDSYPAVVDVLGNEEGEKLTFDAILQHATANNNEWSFKRYADHGLVYADYYFIELGNKLMRMGLV